MLARILELLDPDDVSAIIVLGCFLLSLVIVGVAAYLRGRHDGDARATIRWVTNPRYSRRGPPDSGDTIGKRTDQR